MIFLIKKYKTVGIKHLNDSKIFVEHSQYLNISLVFITQSCFKKILLLIISENIDHKDCVSIYRKCTSKPYYFLTINTTLPASNPLECRRNILLPL